jgi:peptidyl-prolyl cis-trans isomerase D
MRGQAWGSQSWLHPRIVPPASDVTYPERRRSPPPVQFVRKARFTGGGDRRRSAVSLNRARAKSSRYNQELRLIKYQENSLSMFNLFRSRDKAVRILLTGLLALVALSMVTYLIPNSGSGYGGTTDSTVVATIGKDQITTQDVSKAIQNMTRNRQLPPELLSIYVPQIVNQLINERMMAFEAGRLGLKVSSDETDSAIIDQLPPQLIKDGKVDGATLTAMLQQEGLTMAQLKNDTTRTLLVNRLEHIVSSGVVVSPTEIEKEFRHKNDKIKIDYAVISATRFQAEGEATDAEVKAYYDAHKSDFKVPEKRSYGLLLLDPEKIGAQSVPTDAQLQAEYTSRKSDFQLPERVKVRHILLKIDAQNPDAQVKPKAEALLKQIQTGGDFAALAKANSQDPGSGAQGGELGYIVKGQTVPEFEKAAFSLAVGQTSGLVKTTYGYHILQVEAHEQPHFQPFDEVKAQLMSEYQKRVAGEKMQSLADRAVSELRKNPTHLDQIAQELGLTALRADNIQPGDPVPGLGVSKDFDDAVAGLRKGDVTSGPVSLQNGKAAIAVENDVQPAHPSTFDEAKADARTRAGKEKMDRILAAKAKELADKVNANGGDLQKAAKEMKIEVKTSGDVDRQGAIEAVGTASTIPGAFDKPVGTIFGPLPVSGGQLVAKLLAKTPASIVELPAQMNAIRDELKQQKQRDRAQLFQEGLKARLTSDGKVKINQDVITRIVQSYSQRS